MLEAAWRLRHILRRIKGFEIRIGQRHGNAWLPTIYHRVLDTHQEDGNSGLLQVRLHQMLIRVTQQAASHLHEPVLHAWATD